MNPSTMIHDFHEWLHDEWPELLNLVTCWEICSTCRGDGTSTAYLGAYTQADREEMGDEWFEFMDDVRAGIYDRACGDCSGTGKVRVVDRDATNHVCPRTLEHWDDWCEQMWRHKAVERQERAMGA